MIVKTSIGSFFYTIDIHEPSTASTCSASAMIKEGENGPGCFDRVRALFTDIKLVDHIPDCCPVCSKAWKERQTYHFRRINIPKRWRL